MTTIYVPRIIETAEQAAALPEGTFVLGVEAGERYTRTFEGDWWGVTEMGTSLAVDLDAGDVVVALVPVEAEEETTTPVQGFAGVFHVSRPAGSFPAPQRRLFTPWEEV